MKSKPKHNLHRITALLLALLFITATLSPTLVVKASDDDWTSAGAGETVGGITETSSPTITDNDDGTRTLNLKQSASLLNGTDIVSGLSSRIKITGFGRFVVRSFYWHYDYTDKTKKYGITSYLFSDKPFNYKSTLTPLGAGTVMTIDGESLLYKGIYYVQLPSGISGSYDIGSGENYKFSYSGFANVMHLFSDTYPTAQQLIDSGDLDLTKDDWQASEDVDPNTYVYDKSLGYLQGVKYYENKILGEEREGIISWNASNPNLNDCWIEIRANNFYVEWWNKKTSEIWSYKRYGSVSYKDGQFSFKTLEPCRTWLSEKNINPYAINTQSYGTTEYYVRLLRLDKNNNVIKCGGWVKIDINRGSSTELPDSTSDTGGFDDDTGDWNDDDDSDDSYHDHTGGDGESLPNPELDFERILESIYSLFGLIGSFPSFLGQIFSFLPSWLINSVSVSIALTLVIAVYKMIRG